MVDETGRNDMKVAELINIGIRMKEKILVTFKDNKAVHNRLMEIFGSDEYKKLLGPEKRLITLFDGLKPDKPLAEDCLVFDPVLMKNWVDQGEKKAKEVLSTTPFV